MNFTTLYQPELLYRRAAVKRAEIRRTLCSRSVHQPCRKSLPLLAALQSPLAPRKADKQCGCRPFALAAAAPVLLRTKGQK